MKDLWRHSLRERGQMVVMMAVLILGILAFAGLVLDFATKFAVLNK